MLSFDNEINMKIKKKLGVGVIIQNQNGDFLLHLRDGKTINMPNQWSLVGGGVEDGESVETAAIRETKEETSLTAQKLTKFSTINFNEKWDAIIFHVLVDTKHEKMVLHEGKKLMFFSKEKVKVFINKLSYSNPFLDVFKLYLSDF